MTTDLVHVCDVDPDEVKAVLQRALETHLEGLKEAKVAVTTDGTIDDPQDLADVAGDMDRDMDVSRKVLEALSDGA
jgi:hypothetical protein